MIAKFVRHMQLLMTAVAVTTYAQSVLGIKIGEIYSNNRLTEFSLVQGSKCNFHFDCPMSKCLGDDSGIYYEQPISEMVRQHENHRKVKLTCVGYGGYNLTFHCDWYAVLDISITYR